MSHDITHNDIFPYFSKIIIQSYIPVQDSNITANILNIRTNDLISELQLITGDARKYISEALANEISKKTRRKNLIDIPEYKLWKLLEKYEWTILPGHDSKGYDVLWFEINLNILEYNLDNDDIDELKYKLYDQINHILGGTKSRNISMDDDRLALLSLDIESIMENIFSVDKLFSNEPFVWNNGLKHYPVV